MAQVRVKIGSTDYSLATEIIPVGWDTVLNYRKDTDSRNFIEEPKNDFVLYCRALPTSWESGGTAWDNLAAATGACYTFQINIETKCSGSWSSVWTGEFSSKDWKINYDKQTITVKIKKNSDLDCLKLNWGNEVNLYDLSPVVSVKPYYFTYKTHEESITATPGVECSVTVPFVFGYCNFDIQRIPSGGSEKCVYFYHRFERPGTCSGSSPVPPDDFSSWAYLSGSCPGTPLFWACPETERTPYEYPNGRYLGDVIQMLMDETGCGLLVVSDFLNINPDASAPSNVAYDAALLYLQTLVVFQKSDVKRPDASDTSRFTAWNMKLQDLINDLKILFNMDWKIVEGVFRIEHVSYFQSTAGADCTAEKYARGLQQDKSNIAKFTKFQYRDVQCSNYFTGYPIEIYCGEGTAEKKLSLFSCDIDFISDVDNAESVGDDGWVLMSTYIDTGVLYNQNNNRELSWFQLHQDFYRHEMAGAGKINTVDATPLSLKKNKKQPPFAVRHCCNDTFDPDNYITTSMGDADIEVADKNLAQDSLTLDVKY